MALSTVLDNCDSKLFFIRSWPAFLRPESRPLRGRRHSVGEGKIHPFHSCIVLRGGSTCGCSGLSSHLASALGDGSFLWPLGRADSLSNICELETQLRN